MLERNVYQEPMPIAIGHQAQAYSEDKKYKENQINENNKKYFEKKLNDRR